MIRHERHRALTAVGLLALLCVGAAPAGAATGTPTPSAAPQGSGSIGIRLVDAPAATRDDPRARVYIVDHLKPGSVIERRVEVSNTTRAAEHLMLYAAAASITRGSFLGAAAHTSNDLSSWTTVSPAKPDVPPGGVMTATVTIAVPKDAAPGEQYGVVWAEARSAPNGGGGVVQVSRVGIRLYVSVGPGGAPAADFAIDGLTAKRSSDGRPVVVASVLNTGGRALDMSGGLTLASGPGGLRAGPFPATLSVTLGIGDTEPLTIVLDKQLPAGPWDAQVTLRSGLVERTAKGRLTFPNSGAAATVTTRSVRPVWPLVTAGMVALLFGVLGLLLARRRREQPGNVPRSRAPSRAGT
jgi:hypothetical protein